MFEGYVGIRLWDGQLVDDVIHVAPGRRVDAPGRLV